MHKPTIHGIDPTAPGGIQALMDFHRQTFGDAVMEAEGGEGAGDGSNGSGGEGGEPAGNQDGAKPDDKGGDKSEKPWGDDANFDPEKAWRLIEGLRADKTKADGKAETAAQKAAEAAQTELTQKLGKALGLIKDGEGAPNADELTKALSERDGQIKELTIQAAMPDALDAAGANKLTPAVLKGEGKLQDLDPSADDFQEKLNGLVKDAVARHPELKAAQAAGQSGADFNGQSGEKRAKPTNMKDAIAAHYGT